MRLSEQKITKERADNMQSVYLCYGYLQNDPAPFKLKNGVEGATFNLLIKRNSKKSIYDVFNFKAYNNTAKYVLEWFHKGDCVSLQSRPKLYNVPDGKGGLKEIICFDVKQADFICKRHRLALDKFGTSTIEEMEEKFN